MSLKSSLQNKYTAAKSVFKTDKGKLSDYSKAAITIAVIILILGIIFGLINNRNRSINIKEIETTVNQIMAEQEQLALEQAEKERAEAAEQEQLALEQAEKEITEAIAKDGSDVLNDEKYQESVALLEKNTISIILRRGQAPYPRLAIEKNITAVCTSTFTVTQKGLAENIETSCNAKMYRNQFKNSSQRSIKGSLFKSPEPNQRKTKIIRNRFMIEN